MVKINFGKKHLAILLLGIALVISVGYAVAWANPTSGVGHDTTELQPCPNDGEILKMAGGAWACDDMVSGLWAQSGSDIYYAGGSVGIGTATPARKLTLDVGSAQDGIDIYGTSAPELRLGNMNDGHANIIYFNNDQTLRLGTSEAGGWDVLNIKNGNVGIGTTSPGTNKLKVEGNIDASGFTEAGSNTLTNSITGNAATATTATAFVANPANCGSNQYPRGISADGTVELCTDDSDYCSGGTCGGIYLTGPLSISNTQSFSLGDSVITRDVILARIFRGTCGINGGACLRGRLGHEISLGWYSNSEFRMFVDGTYVKSFIIDHPVDPNKYLVHTTLEGPEVGVYYRGEARLINGKTIVELPSYFEALTKEEGRTVLLTPVLEDDNKVSNLATSRVKDGRFTVKAIDSNNPSQLFFWEVKAERKDTKVIVEPDKEDITVKGFGPYKYYSPNRPDL